MTPYSTGNIKHNRGSILALVVIIIVILLLLGIGLLTVAYGVRMRAIRLKNDTAAMLAAEAGYEQAIFWMNKQFDVLTSISKTPPAPGSTGAADFGDSKYSYSVTFHDFIKHLPVFRVTSTGRCADTQRIVDVLVIQAISGWDMGMCRIPDGTSSTEPVYFASGEIINIPVHINNFHDNPDNRDIHISGSPPFNALVEMGESRYTAGSEDKYNGVMDLFDGGIFFDQPDVRIADRTAVQDKLERFRDSTLPAYRFDAANGQKPQPNPIFGGEGAVQLEFFTSDGTMNGNGMVRITNNCTVAVDNGGTRDWIIDPAGSGNTFKKYNIYNYHYQNNPPVQGTPPVSATYVPQATAGGVLSGQIYIDGNVIIGGDGVGLPGGPTNQVIVGKLTIVATGNIWIADSIIVGGEDRNINTDMPSSTNPNALGLIAGGVVKIIDPGLSDDASDRPNLGLKYAPVANDHSGVRRLNDPMIVEAAVTVGGGGWGAENVGHRTELSSPQDDLILRGTICEAFRGVVGIIDQDGYLKHYYLDSRFLEGVLPGNIWFSGKYVPAPAGWHDYRTTN